MISSSQTISQTSSEVFTYMFESRSIQILGKCLILTENDEEKIYTSISQSAPLGITVINLSEGKYFPTINKIGLGDKYPIISVMLTEYDIKAAEAPLYDYYYYMTVTPDKKESENNNVIKNRIYNKIGRKATIDINMIVADATLSIWQKALQNAGSVDAKIYQK